MKYLLDTNIISAITRPERYPKLIGWMSEQADVNLFTSTMTLAEVRRGILALPQGRKKETLTTWFDGPGGLEAMFAGRILPFNSGAAKIWAELMVGSRAKGHNRDAVDTIIAATALAHDCVVVTANTRDFDGVETLNPM